MENKLISMVDFVLEQYKVKQSPYNFWKKTEKYANFLKQPLKLGMFLPCDENDVPLVEPEIRKNSTDALNFTPRMIRYQQAKDRVLFDGFELCERNPNLPCLVLKKELVFDDIHFVIDHLLEYKIEDLVQHNLTLTPNALKQFEL
jgi:hypothetical protein